MVNYTPVLKLVQPDFDQVPWDEAMNGNMAILDATYGKFFAAQGLSGAWANATAYVVGQVLVDQASASMWSCLVSHTSSPAPVTFAQDRAAYPANWGYAGVIQAYLPITGGTLTGQLGLSGATDTQRGIWGYSGSTPRWFIDVASLDAETGGNAGSRFIVYRFDDGGTFIDAPLIIDRATGFMTVNDLTTGNAIRWGNTGGYIAGDANTVTFALDGSLWRWEYVRTGPSAGVMQYTRGADNQILFKIDSLGNVTCHGTITSGGVMADSTDRIVELEARVTALEAKIENS